MFLNLCLNKLFCFGCILLSSFVTYTRVESKDSWNICPEAVYTSIVSMVLIALQIIPILILRKGYMWWVDCLNPTTVHPHSLTIFVMSSRHWILCLALKTTFWIRYTEWKSLSVNEMHSGLIEMADWIK